MARSDPASLIIPPAQLASIRTYALRTAAEERSERGEYCPSCEYARTCVECVAEAVQ